jgi:hypothetical protein
MRAVLCAVVGVLCTSASAQEPSLWSYTGNEGGGPGFQIRQFAITPDAKRAVTFAQQIGSNSPQKPKFVVWDFVNGKQISAWRGETTSVDLAISNDGAMVASLGLSRTDEGPAALDLWHVASGKKLVQTEVQPKTGARRTSIRFSKDGKGLFLLGGSVQVLEVGSGKVVAVGGKRSFPAEDIDWAVSADRLIWLDPDRISVFAPAEQLARGGPPKQTIKMPYQATDARLSSDGKTAYVSLMPNDGPRAGFQFLGAWNLANGKQLQQYDCQWRELEFIRNLHVSPDGQFAAGNRGRRDSLWIYDLKKNVAPDFPNERMVPVGFTPGGVLIVRMSGRPLRFLDPATFKILKTPLTDAQRGGGKQVAPKGEPILASEIDPKLLFRTWTSSNGKYTIEAFLVRKEDGVAHLRMKDGKVIQVPIAKLSAADRKFLAAREKRN